MSTLKVLYYTVVPLAGSGNGGSICCRNHVARLVADPDIELTAMVAGPGEIRAATESFFADLGVRCHYQPFRNDNIRHSSNRIGDILRFATKMVFQFPWELTALNQPHIEEGIAWAIKGYSIDVLVVDYHPSAMFIQLPRNDAKSVLISLNREGDFYADQIRLGQIHHGSLTAGISLSRARNFERGVDAAVDKVVTIGPPDLPRHPVRTPPVSITPYLDAKPERWHYSASRSAFFVGDINHYPNKLAVSWLTQRLAPALLRLDTTIRITVIGAAPENVAETDRLSNIEFLGRSDAATVAKMFCTADLMICPIENDYGVKFKAVEALAYGSPLLASRQTLLGLPHLHNTPCLDLGDPDAAALLIKRLINDVGALADLQSSQQRQQDDFVASQSKIWSRLLKQL